MITTIMMDRVMSGLLLIFAGDELLTEHLVFAIGCLSMGAYMLATSVQTTPPSGV